MRFTASFSAATLPASVFVLFALACGSSSSGSSSSGSDGGIAAGSCTGQGSLVVNITGLVVGTPAGVTITGDGTTKKAVMNNQFELPAGTYKITADDAIEPDAVARGIYRAKVKESSVEVCAGKVAVASIEYAAIATSGRLWVDNANGAASLLGFQSGILVSGGNIISGHLKPKTVTSKSIAFDKEGNLWSIGGTTAEPTLVRYEARSLGEPSPGPDRGIKIKNSGCSPFAEAIAFDGAGNLWVSALCEKKILRIPASEIPIGGEISPDVEITELTSPRGIAFDVVGNLWVADGAIKRYDAGRLGASTNAAPDATLQIANAPAEQLAFDANRDLWSVGGAQTNLTKIAYSALGAPGARDVTPVTSISLGVGALPSGIAFDETGGLWVATSAGKFGRLAPAQLSTSSTYADPTIPDRVISSPDVGSAGAMAIFPAPAAIPLYHRLP